MFLLFFHALFIPADWFYALVRKRLRLKQTLTHANVQHALVATPRVRIKQRIATQLRIALRIDNFMLGRWVWPCAYIKRQPSQQRPLHFTLHSSTPKALNRRGDWKIEKKKKTEKICPQGALGSGRFWKNRWVHNWAKSLCLADLSYSVINTPTQIPPPHVFFTPPHEMMEDFVRKLKSRNCCILIWEIKTHCL